MQSAKESPINNLVLLDRKMMTFHKLSYTLILIAGLDLIASAYTFDPMIQNSLSSAHASILGSWTALFLAGLVGLFGAIVSYSGYNFSKDRYAKHQRLFIKTGIASIVFAMFAFEAYVQSTSLFYIAQYSAGAVLALLAIWLGSKSSN